MVKSKVGGSRWSWAVGWDRPTRSTAEIMRWKPLVRVEGDNVRRNWSGLLIYRDQRWEVRTIKHNGKERKWFRVAKQLFSHEKKAGRWYCLFECDMHPRSTCGIRKQLISRYFQELTIALKVTWYGMWAIKSGTSVLTMGKRAWHREDVRVEGRWAVSIWAMGSRMDGRDQILKKVGPAGGRPVDFNMSRWMWGSTAEITSGDQMKVIQRRKMC